MLIEEIDQTEINEEKIDQLANAISRRCTQVLDVYRRTNASNTKFLYRGMFSENKFAFIGKPHKARKPTHSNPIYQHFFDIMLTKLGYKAIRSNSIFTTGSKEFASGYGDTYIIFPVDGFHFTWSETVDDLILKGRPKMNLIFNLDFVDDEICRKFDRALRQKNVFAEDMLHKLNTQLKWIIDYPVKSVMSLPDMHRFRIVGILFNALWNSDNPKLIEFINSIIGSEQQFIEKFIDLEKASKFLRLDNKNLHNAILSGNEIYIHGAYYAISNDSLKFKEPRDLLLNKLGLSADKI